MQLIKPSADNIKTLLTGGEIIPIGSTSDIGGTYWHADLRLRFAKTARGTRLVESHHCGPLYVQKPFYPEGPDLAHVYLLHPPGGIVSGDELKINLNIMPNSQALFTTPGAGRIYRARSDKRLQHQQVKITIADQASAEWFPMETIVYPGSIGKLTTRIELDKQAVFSGWEITCLGLPASGELYNSGAFTGSLNQRFEIYQNQKLLFLERLKLDSDNLLFQQAQAGMQGKPVSGLLVSGPFLDKTIASRLLDNLRQISLADEQRLTKGKGKHQPLLATTYVNNFMVTRYLGDCAQQAKKLFIACLRSIRPVLLHREMCTPRIWET